MEKKKTKEQCDILRRKVVTSFTVNMETGEESGHRKEVTDEPCGTPLFGNDRYIGVCKSCRDGWQTPQNILLDTPDNVQKLGDALKIAIAFHTDKIK